jgi:hypothetical protein
LALVEQAVQLVVTKRHKRFNDSVFQPLRLLVVDMAVGGEPLEELLVVPVVPVAVAQKIANAAGGAGNTPSTSPAQGTNGGTTAAGGSKLAVLAVAVHLL